MKTINVAHIAFRNGPQDNEELRGFIRNQIAEGCVIFTWEKETIIFPLDTIKNMTTTVEEE